MEIKIKLPSGGYLEFKWEPMAQGRFEAICWLIGIFLVGSGFLKFFAFLF